MADSVIFGEWTDSGTRVELPLGSYYFQYSSSFGNQGAVSVLCNGSTSINSSNAHYVTGNVVGNVKIALTDMDTGEVRELINSNRATAGVTLTDATHKYSLAMDSNGGVAQVTCPTCGSVNYIYGSATMLFRALGTYDAKIRKQPTTQIVDDSGQATFSCEGIQTNSYQWQISEDGVEYSDITNGRQSGGAVASGAESDTLTLNNVPYFYNGYKLRSQLTGLSGNVIYSDAASLIANQSASTIEWTTPKVNWLPTDRFNIVDHNRIKNNLYLFLVDDDYVKYDNRIIPIPDIQLYTAAWSVDNFNMIESWLEMLAQAYNKDFGARKTFYANGLFIDYNELNRIERATLELKSSEKNGSLLLGYLVYSESGNRYTVTGLKVNEIVNDNVETLIIPTTLGDYEIAF